MSVPVPSVLPEIPALASCLHHVDERVQLYRGDAVEVLAAVPDGSVDAVIADPPYSLGTASHARGGSTWADLLNASRWYSTWYAQCARALRPEGVLWTLANWRTLPIVSMAAEDAGLDLTGVVVWDKQWIGPGGTRGLRSRYELIAPLPMPAWRQPDRRVPDVWQIQGMVCKKPSGHPGEKPLALVEQILAVSNLPDDAQVLDPFAGSGTTLRAAMQAGHRAIGIELSPRWCALATRRLTTPQNTALHPSER